MSPVRLTGEEVQRIYAAISYLLNHLHEDLSVKQLARHAALSEVKLKEGFYQLFDIGPGEYIYHTKMLLGYFLLSHTEKPIKEIAWHSGYQYPKNFMTAFRRYFGMPAGAVRRIRKEERVTAP